jgi:hypothetical protein
MMWEDKPRRADGAEAEVPRNTISNKWVAFRGGCDQFIDGLMRW